MAKERTPIEVELPEVEQPYLPVEISRVIRRLEAIEWALDRQFAIPGTKIRFGWDSIVGLIPGVGDLASFVPLGFYVAVARRYKLGNGVYFHLAWNHFIDFLIGTIPLLGDVFDIGFKANTRNAALLSRKLKKQFAM